MWMGVGQHSWEKVLDSKQPFLRTAGKGGSSRLWVFGDSLMRGVGQAIHSLSKERYEIVDRSVSGASIGDIRKTVEDNLSQLMPEDLVLVEGGGNGLERIGGTETTRVMEEIVSMVKGKISRRPLVMCIPMRRGKERGSFGQERKRVNRVCVAKLEDWGCDGLKLWERMDWRKVWAQDGVHLSNIGKVWTAWNVVEWAQHWEEARTGRQE